MKTAHIYPGMTGWVTLKMPPIDRGRIWVMRRNNGTYVSVSGVSYPDDEIRSFQPATRN